MMKARPSKVPWDKGEERFVGGGEMGRHRQTIGSFVDLGFVLLGNWERRCLVFPRKGTLNPKP